MDSFTHVLGDGGLEKRVSPTKVIILAFVFIIFLGACFLMLPAANKSGLRGDFITALFTATSATCVTGLVVTDTLSHWTRFGQVVIMILIQCGGLGFMAFATVFSLIVNRRISLRERLIMTQSFSVDEISGVVRLAKHILFRTLIAEGIGAVILSIRFVPQFGLGEGLFKSVFHAVSAFCNAGFDVIGICSGHIGSMSQYIGDPLVCLTLVSLMVFGGLGFLVWEDLRIKKRFSALGLHTKLVIIMTASLLTWGTVMFMLLEYSNPATIGNLNFFEKLLASLFQSATSRTAGFYTFSQSGMTVSSKMVSVILMFIGGSPGSTAGGIKTVTLAVILITSACVMRGKSEVTAFERKIPVGSILKAVAVVTVALFIAIIASVILVIFDGVSMMDAVFECVSAFSTTGLSTGITPNLSAVSKMTLIVLMYFGRVGLLTMSIGLSVGKRRSKIGYADGKVIIG